MGWHPLPRELAEMLQRLLPRLLPDGCFDGNDMEKRDRSPMGSARPHQGHASSLGAALAMAMDLPPQPP